MTGTAEFETIIKHFEKSVTQSWRFRSLRLDRCVRPDGSGAETKGEFYESGETNQIFHAFLMGYSLAKNTYQS